MQKPTDAYCKKLDLKAHRISAVANSFFTSPEAEFEIILKLIARVNFDIERGNDCAIFRY